MVDMVSKEQLAARAKAKELVQRLVEMPKKFPRAVGLEEYEPRSDDIVVTTFPKSGTTLTQQLAYQVAIATGGAPDFDPEGLNFDDICEVVPYVDFGSPHGFPPIDSNPRLFKSHSTPKLFKSDKQKHLIVVRDPCAYPASFLDFVFEAWAGEVVTDPLVLEAVYHEVVGIRLLGLAEGQGYPFDLEDNAFSSQANDEVPVGGWFLHTKAWLDSMRPNTLVMFYEDMIKDIGAAGQRVAKFMGRELDEEGLKHVRARCDRDYMSQDIKFKCTKESVVLGFGEKAEKCKPKDRKGFKQFKVNDEEKAELKKRFQQVFGVDSYEDLKDMINKKQKDLGVDY